MKIDHIGLYVSDLEAAKDFFVKYFDAQVGEMYHNPRKQFKSYFLTFGDGARLEIMTRPGIDGPRTTGDGYYESCISAIDGNLIEITV